MLNAATSKKLKKNILFHILKKDAFNQFWKFILELELTRPDANCLAGPVTAAGNIAIDLKNF
jgi:hypothetical protein